LLVLEQEDFYAKETSQPIRITATFVDLTGVAVQDAQIASCVLDPAMLEAERSAAH